MENVTFDYKFYRIPKRFFKEDMFRDMTNAAKVLYGILLDRKCLSDSNGDAWRDEYGITYIIFTIEEIMNLMNLGNKKVNKMVKELEEHGLIYRRHQGLGRPNKIYVYDLLKADNSNWLPKQIILYSEKGAAMRKKYYEDAKENAAFERCADVITSLILKYGPALKRKWNLDEWIRNIQAESLWKDIACKRYQRYFICMMNMKSLPV